jgi:hypothetical protein
MENKAPARVFADDMAVTFKYWETVIRKSYSQPEKELMLAVLKDAIMISRSMFTRGTRYSRRLRRGYLTGNGIGSFPLERFAPS